MMPIAWLHDKDGRIDVIHDETKAIWMKIRPSQVENYTIPLHRIKPSLPLSTDVAMALMKSTLGVDSLTDGNMLKVLRAVEKAHGIGV